MVAGWVIPAPARHQPSATPLMRRRSSPRRSTRRETAMYPNPPDQPATSRHTPPECTAEGGATLTRLTSSSSCAHHRAHYRARAEPRPSLGAISSASDGAPPEEALSGLNRAQGRPLSSSWLTGRWTGQPHGVCPPHEVSPPTRSPTTGTAPLHTTIRQEPTRNNNNTL